MISYLYKSQNQDEYKNFCTDFDILLNINGKLSLYLIVTGNFNARCSRWSKNDITNFQGQQLDSLTLTCYKTPPCHVLILYFAPTKSCS